MLKGLPILCTFLLLLLRASPATATTFVDSLQKRFKKLDYANDYVIVRITPQTHIPNNAGNHIDVGVTAIFIPRLNIFPSIALKSSLQKLSSSLRMVSA